MTDVVTTWKDGTTVIPNAFSGPSEWNQSQLQSEIEVAGFPVLGFTYTNDGWTVGGVAHPADTMEIAVDAESSGNETAYNAVISSNMPQAASGRFSGSVVGTTSDPTTGSTSFVLMPEMTLSGEFLGGQVRVDFTCSFVLSSTLLGSDGADMALYLDGSEIDVAYRTSVRLSGVTMTAIQNADIHAVIDVPAGNHTIEIRWRRNGTQATITAEGTQRTLRVQEQGN